MHLKNLLNFFFLLNLKICIVVFITKTFILINICFFKERQRYDYKIVKIIRTKSLIIFTKMWQKII